MSTEFLFRSQSNAKNFYRANAKSQDSDVDLSGSKVVISEDDLDIVRCLSKFDLLELSNNVEFHLWDNKRADVIIRTEHEIPRKPGPITELNDTKIGITDQWVNALRSEQQDDRLKAIRAIESHPEKLPPGVDALLPVLVKALQNPSQTQHARRAIAEIGEQYTGSVRKYLNEIEPLQERANALVARQASELVEQFSEAEENLNESHQNEEERDTVQQERYLRSDQFRKEVREAYDNKCAVCAKRRFSPDGDPEVEAGHIKPVQDGGPDRIQNGAAFCKLHHWAFDSGWISFTDDYEVTVLDAPETFGFEDFAEYDGQSLYLPEHAAKYPDQNYLQHHRRKHGFD